jgi:deoxyhypusine synthase
VLLDKFLVEQNETGFNWTPSKLIHRLGKEINNEDSVYYWAAKNDIPVFCPAITDGGIGDTLFYHSFKNPGLKLDLIEDIQRMDLLALFAVNTGAIILGGGTSKHHILNANCMRNGLNFSVFVNTGQEFDGSDSGAKPDEALSWAKIRPEATPVKVYGEASLIFPLLVSQTFAKNFPIKK